MNEKPHADCDGCRLYGPECHCLCHYGDYIGGKHEIVYTAGPGPVMREYPGERDHEPVSKEA